MILLDLKGHMVSDFSLEELHQFAEALGLKRCWFQGGSHPHYDLTTERKKLQALRIGANPVSSRRLVREMVRQ